MRTNIINTLLAKSILIIFILIIEGVLYDIFADTKINDTIQVRKLLTQSIKYQDIDPVKADSFATVALAISKKNNYSFGLSESYFCLASTDRVRNHNIEAIEYYSKSLLNVHRDSIFKIQKIYQWLGLCLAYESQFDSSIVYLNKSLQLAQKIKNKRQIAEVFVCISKYHLTKNEYQNALDYCQKARNICDSTLNPDLLWRIKNFIGWIKLNMGNYKEAMELFYETLPEINNSTFRSEDKYKLYVYIATVHYNLKDYSKSVYYHSLALQQSKKINNKELANYYYGNTNFYMGVIFKDLNNFDSASIYLREAENSIEYMKDLQAKEMVYYRIGEVFFNKKQYDSSFYYYLKGKKVSEMAKDTFGMKLSSLGIGKIYFELKNYKNAINYLEDAVNNKYITDEIILDGSKYLSELYSQLGCYKKALHYYILYKETSDKKFNEENIKRITQLELQYIFDDKQKKSEFARQQEKLLFETQIRNNRTTMYLVAFGFIISVLFSIAIFRQYRNKRQANHEKEILIKEIHHRVKNNLQVISSMLSLQSSYLADQKIKDAVAESQGRVKAMALIHQMLYQHDDFSAIEIDVYIEQLCSVISSTYSTNEKIKLNTEIEKLKLDIDTAIPLGLIVNEILTNSYKYAFAGREDGLIRVEIMRKTADKYYLCIKDDGIGIPLNVVESPSGKSLGLNLVKILTRQLKGNLEIKTEKGTSFEITFTEIIKTSRKTA